MIVKTLKITVVRLLFRPVIELLFIVLIWIHGFRRFSAGQIVFWGDRDFLTLCAKALEQLGALDKILYERIVAGPKLRFYSSEKRSEQIIDFGLFNMNTGFCDRGIQGVVARIVYAHFARECLGGQYFSRSERHRAKGLHDLVKKQTHEWLKGKEFSGEIVEVFG